MKGLLYVCCVCLVAVGVSASTMGQNEVANVGEDYSQLLATKRISCRFTLPTEGNPAPSVKLKVIGAPWCAPCQRLKPVLKALQKEGYQIEKVELDRPGVPVPYLQFSQFGEIVREDKGTKTEQELRQIFAEIEGAVFKS